MAKLNEKWKKLSKAGKALIIGSASLVVLLLLFAFLPVMKVSYLVEESYTEVETYHTQETEIVLEPYTYMETYTEVEAHCDQPPCEEYIPLDYRVVSAEGYNYYEFDGSPACTVEIYIENLDEEGGTFRADLVLSIQHDLTTEVDGSKFVGAGNTDRIVITFYDGALESPTSFTYSITPPTKPDPSYWEEVATKEREVTDYQEVTQYVYIPEEVTVAKTRTVTVSEWVSLLTYLIDY